MTSKIKMTSNMKRTSEIKMASNMKRTSINKMTSKSNEPSKTTTQKILIYFMIYKAGKKASLL